ncbi:MAG: sulfotransferase family protein [Gammaproteobacteria bacterium]|nr:sulfotransferase family protein [Gammaproteobacteria bacterium]
MSLKHMIKNKAIDLFKKFLSHEDVSDLFSKKVRAATQHVGIKENTSSPYFNYQKLEHQPALKSDVVFITGRFRSGSSVFWNLFRAQPDCTAYYEPFNERRWFDIEHRGQFVDSSHKGIQDYWTEYDNLGHLSHVYDEKWINTALHMDEYSYDSNMRAFINSLIEHSKGRSILQFNRIDFRLPWLKKNYPNAKFLHIYRNPRDQWLSFLTDKQKMNSAEVHETYQDAFYLDVWCKDLAKQFPFLSPAVTAHPYMRFYYLWKLSYLYGIKYCDYSVPLERLTSAPIEELNTIKSILNWTEFDIQKSVAKIESITMDKWRTYADESWFLEKEQICEAELDCFFNTSLANNNVNQMGTL